MTLTVAQQSGHWVHDLSPFLIRFNENLGIRWYGVSYLLGFLVTISVTSFTSIALIPPLDPDQQANLMTYIILGVLCGGRLGYVFLYSSGRASFFENPLYLFKVWEGEWLAMVAS